MQLLFWVVSLYVVAPAILLLIGRMAEIGSNSRQLARSGIRFGTKRPRPNDLHLGNDANVAAARLTAPVPRIAS